MSLLETMVALTIAAGVISAALETAYLTAQRTMLANLEMEAILRAEALLAWAGTDPSNTAAHREGTDGETVRWTLDMERDDAGNRPPAAMRIVARVTITRDGASTQQELATLKLVPEPVR
jgi:hypothetical protein